MAIDMIRKAAPVLLLALFLPLASWAGETLDNEYFSLDLPEGWEEVSSPPMANDCLSINLAKKTGDCLINISITAFSGTAEELIRQMSKTMAENGLVMGELRHDGDIYYSRFKKKENSGIFYVGANGQSAGIITIYGSGKAQRAADRILSALRLKKAHGLFPDFK